MPIGMASVVCRRDTLGRPIDMFTVHRQSQHSFTWRIVDPDWRGTPEAGFGKAGTHEAAERAAMVAWRAGR